MYYINDARKVYVMCSSNNVRYFMDLINAYLTCHIGDIKASARASKDISMETDVSRCCRCDEDMNRG